MSVLLLVLVALTAGAGIAVQAGVNSHLGRSLGNPLLAAFVSFAVGTVALAAALLVARPALPDALALRAIPLWAWTGGVLGAFFVSATIVVAPRLGAASLVALLVAAQLATALFLDHFGFLGFEARAATVPRLLGVALLAAGAVLIRLT